jgi:hypothetical protein
MEMGMFKLAFMAVVAFLSAIGIFIGCVTLLTSLQNGAIALSYDSGGKAITETISRAGDSDRFWRLLLWMGLAPIVIGVGALWYSVRKLRGN